MKQRIKRLLDISLHSVERLTDERALLVTEFYKSKEASGLSAPMVRAKAFEHILNKKSLYFDDDEYIVGERGPFPKSTPTYPEICLHSIEDLETLDTRPKVSFKVDEEMIKQYNDVVIPFWQGHSNRERIMEEMSTEWKDAYQAGVFTEFQEQRAPGHTALGHKGFHTGFLSLMDEIDQAMNHLDFFEDAGAFDKKEQLLAMKTSARAMINYAQRYAKMLEQKAVTEKEVKKRNEYFHLANICRNVPALAPETFHEALQHYWFIHLGVITEVNPWDSFNPGRLDQHLYPYYRKGVNDGSLTKKSARTLLQAFWIKFNNHPAPPKVGITARESSTYTDFCLINLGGIRPDGTDAVNELSYLILDVIEEMRILQPSSMVQISKFSPDQFIHRALEIAQTGFGQPSFFNSDAIIKELTLQGKDLEDARNGGASGCVESGAFGTECYFLTGYFNLNKILELTMHNGLDPGQKKQIGLQTGDPNRFDSFDTFMGAFEKQLRHFIDMKIRGNNIIEQIFTRFIPVPFLSLFIEDCISNGKDYNAGGARYNTSYIQGVGLGSIADSLTAIRYHVYEEKTFSFSELIHALENDFTGFEEMQHQLLYNTPKYGNDEDYADEQAVLIFNLFHNAVNGRPTPRGGAYRINMLPTTSHVYFGSVIGAMPDGRNAFQPLSEGISPTQGADRKGPTAVLNSAIKFDHLKTGGTLLNQKFTPSFFRNDEAIDKLRALIRAYFQKNGHHIQFNVVNAATLREAQAHPEKHRNLIVRVAGYSDYFNDLGEDLQDEIIKRTEQDGSWSYL